jgi:hypothetical protein
MKSILIFLLLNLVAADPGSYCSYSNPDPDYCPLDQCKGKVKGFHPAGELFGYCCKPDVGDGCIQCSIDTREDGVYGDGSCIKCKKGWKLVDKQYQWYGEKKIYMGGRCVQKKAKGG